METKINILDHLAFDAPTSEQVDVLNAMAAFVAGANKDDFFVLCGAAGTGKSSITSALVGYLNDRSLAYRIAAPTGRAARILGRKTKCQNSTIHSMIYHVDVNAETGEVIFRLKSNDVPDKTIFIIDEASMISALPNNPDLSLFKSTNSLLADLVHYVKSGNAENKIIFLGDRNQLPPINEKVSLALAPEYLRSEFNLSGSVHFLTIVKRQDESSFIMKAAISARVALENNKSYAPIQAFKHNSLPTAAANFVNDFRNNPKDHCISINPFHRGNLWFNREVRQHLFGRKAGILEQDEWLLVTQKWSRHGHELYTGDHVTLEEVNFHLVEVVAGLQFVPVKLKSKNLRGEDVVIEDYLLLDSIQHPSGSLPIPAEKLLRGERFRKNTLFRESGNPQDDKYVGAIRLTYGYSITCHKAQGGEWSKVYMSTFNIPSLNYQYTAITRAVNDLVLY